MPSMINWYWVSGGLILAMALVGFWSVPSYWLIQPPWVHRYATKTAYRHHSYEANSSLQRKAAESVLTPSCRPIHVSAVYRHGTRTPSKKDIAKVLSVYQRLVDIEAIHPYLPDGFLKWKNPFPENGKDRGLVEEGRRELWGLGRRMRNTWGARMSAGSGALNVKKSSATSAGKGYPSLFVNNTRWYTSSSERSRESGIQFAIGLLENELKNPEKDADQLFQTDDKHMRFFDNCQAYLDLVEKNEASNEQTKLFGKGPEMRSVIESIEKRMHLPSNVSLSPKDLKAMFVYCAHEVALYPVVAGPSPYSGSGEAKTDQEEIEAENKASRQLSPWCGFFTEIQRRIMEYFLDLKNYWRKSYGYHISYHQSCILLDHLKETLEEAIQLEEKNTDKKLTGTFSFGHAETLMPLMAVLGFFNESEPLLANNYVKHMWREFRTSTIAPFAANFALVVHKCSISDATNKDAVEYRVQPLLNELPLSWELFRGETDIPWKEFVDYFSFCWKKDFDFHKSCSVKETLSRLPKVVAETDSRLNEENNL